ncbi:MAG: sugar kinase [Bacteroidetes bacterium RBG_19FT_COMBO_42_10]|nr:MAG: sugar kinase [Bacteroidetes bacterium RBG_19FT_COMBO_42_10]
MCVLGVDLGGTKLALAIFSMEGRILAGESVPLENRKGTEVGKLITEHITRLIDTSENQDDHIRSIGISVPGISHTDSGSVWAPNIPGWDDYPLMSEVKTAAGKIPVTIDSDRACYILGELWQGNARGCNNVIFLAVGTGIGAGILVNGEVLRGSHDIAGATGWMALNKPFLDEYKDCGCFEYYASGEGIAKAARAILKEESEYSGELKNKNPQDISSCDVFTAYEYRDPVAVKVIESCIEFWGMAVANLVSLFNPEKIIMGGGVFGPAISLIPAIREEAVKWAQPVSINQVRIEPSALRGEAGVYGAGFLALRALSKIKK